MKINEVNMESFENKKIEIKENIENKDRERNYKK